jgi:hypothetical protein
VRFESRLLSHETKHGMKMKLKPYSSPSHYTDFVAGGIVERFLQMRKFGVSQLPCFCIKAPSTFLGHLRQLPPPLCSLMDSVEKNPETV